MKSYAIFRITLELAAAVGCFTAGSIWQRAGGLRGVQWEFSDAAGDGNLVRLEELHSLGAEIDAIPGDSNLSGAPALDCAASNGRADVVRWLLEKGADPNRIFIDTMPLASAERHLRDTQRTVETLKAHGARSQF